jgi:hypothetical protein
LPESGRGAHTSTIVGSAGDGFTLFAYPSGDNINCGATGHLWFKSGTGLANPIGREHAQSGQCERQRVGQHEGLRR